MFPDTLFSFYLRLNTSEYASIYNSIVIPYRARLQEGVSNAPRNFRSFLRLLIIIIYQIQNTSYLLSI